MKIICIGRNYVNHAKEMNAPLPDVPLFFLKPDTAILPKNNPFFYPNFTKDLHFECELVIKINRLGKNIAEKYASQYYDEVGLGIDFTARDIQKICKEKGHPWEIAKAFEHSAPLSKTFLSLKDKNIQNIDFRLEKNGEIVQQANSSDMIFTVDKIIAYVSQFMTLKIGDLIFTGTPEGVGPVKIGDQLNGFLADEHILSLRIK
ncbi:2-hydroxyhepta-2,4-diene-1,7-dioate isomerase [Brumimicrobium salinarum]|uniref:2-hydroxyhepta-2,4-diene-1,7-dioate isomerase n=1 Tax=Brumimicrobium salinarum TaxID=2058658 RepID=A0A2I0R1C3_9FLAO|nr:fumarylacetoacetate hydrolase family protein [Brumimicrobium salinarum]PKR80382.1 2-hydroxyhepta-2,4-diene-1,7-dioate isomerase [Brumimicrobium salinarum]